MIDDVRIVFTAAPKVSSQIIRWLTRSPVSHVYIEYSSGLWGGRWAAEAGLHGVGKVPVHKAKKNVVATFQCKFDPSAGCLAIRDFFGEDYDRVGALRFGIILLATRWLKTKFKHPLRSTTAQFCSELVARFLMGCRLEGVWNWDPEKSSPGKLYNYCFDNPSRFELVEEPDGV